MTDENLLSEQNQITALKNGDEEAFTKIYHDYWYRMFLVAYRKLQNREVAEEIVQDIFTRLWKERANIQVTNLDYYLFSAVRYEVIDHIRAKGVQGDYDNYFRAFSRFEDLNTENTIVFNDLVNTIHKGLEMLPDKPGEIFRLSRLEHWPVPKIAAHFNLSEKAIEYHLAKATRFFRVYLNEMLISLPFLFPCFL